MKDAFLIDQSHPNQPVSAEFNDLQIDGFDLRTLEGPPRKTQDVMKILLTQKGENLVYTNYGASIGSIPGTRNIPEVVNDLIRDGTVEAMAWLQEMETSARPDERVARISKLSVLRPNSKEVQVNLSVVLESGTAIQASFPVSQ